MPVGGINKPLASTVSAHGKEQRRTAVDLLPRMKGQFICARCFNNLDRDPANEKLVPDLRDHPSRFAPARTDIRKYRCASETIRRRRVTTLRRLGHRDGA